VLSYAEAGGCGDCVALGVVGLCCVVRCGVVWCGVGLIDLEEEE